MVYRKIIKLGACLAITIPTKLAKILGFEAGNIVAINVQKKDCIEVMKVPPIKWNNTKKESGHGKGKAKR